MYMNEKFLNYALQDEVTHIQDGEEIIIKKQDLGILYLKTGKIVANDPCICFEFDEFTISVAPGEYPVHISVAHIDDDRRVAFATMKFSDKNPVKWDMAFTDGEDLSKFEGADNDKFFGYGVDSGTGGFMDKTIADKIVVEELDLYEMFEKQFDDTYVYTYSYAMGNISGGTENEFIAFSSGYGDGTYPCYFGFDENGEVCALVTDFMVLD